MASNGATVAATPDAQLLEAETHPEYRSKEQQVEAILAGGDQPPASEPPEAPETDGQAEPAAETPLDVAGLAEKLGVDPARLYETRIPIANAEPVTLGQLKDAYVSAQQLEAQRSELTSQRGEWHADQLRQQRELDEILSAIPQDRIDPQLAQAVQKVNRERLLREAEALYRTVPEWTDAKARDADLVQMTDHLKAYGITRQDLDAVTDHRLLRYFRAMAQLERKVKAEPVAPRAKPGQAPRRAAEATPAQEFGRLKAAVTKGQMRPADAVSKILGGIK